MSDKTRVQVEIHGQQYTLRVDGDESPEYVEQLASYVEGKIREIAEETPTVDSLKLSILAALNITDEYFRLKLDTDRLDEIIADRVGEMTSMIDELVEKEG